MKALGLALIAALAIGCSSTPTSPTTSLEPTTMLVAQDQKPTPPGVTHTITLYFLAKGHEGRRPVGMPVYVWSDSVQRGEPLTVNSRGSVTFTIPMADTWIGFEVPTWQGICGETEIINIPGGLLPEWNHTCNLKTGCY